MTNFWENISYPSDELYENTKLCCVCRASNDEVALYKSAFTDEYMCIDCASAELKAELANQLVYIDEPWKSLYECVLDKCNYNDMVKEVYI